MNKQQKHQTSPFFSLLLLSLFTFSHAALATENAEDALLEMSIEELMNIEVVSSSKRPQNLQRTPAAMEVITREQIARSGFNSFKDVFRMATGVYSAKIQGTFTSITTRGFDAAESRKLLVLVDGRTVFNNGLNIVDWFEQVFVLDDIERIEIIRGPGSSIWGDNAGNGIFNIITRSAKDTKTSFINAAYGTQEEVVSGRFSGGLSDNFHYRFSGKFYAADESALRPHPGNGFDKSDAGDDLQVYRGYFRADWDLSEQELLTIDLSYLHGDKTVLTTETPITGTNFFFDNTSELAAAPVTILKNNSHTNALSAALHWQYSFSDTNVLDVLGYYQRDDRFFGAEQQVNTLNLEFDHSFKVGNHNLVWGLQYRQISDETKPYPNSTIRYAPEQDVVKLSSIFAQTELLFFDEKLGLTLGSKFEHNNFTGYEIQPTARLLWAPTPDTSLWVAATRATNILGRVSHLRFDSYVNVDPGTGLDVIASVQSIEEEESEKLTAYEFGIKQIFSENLAADLSLYYHKHQDLRDFIALSNPQLQLLPALHIRDQVVVDDTADGESYGVEVTARWQVLEPWSLRANYTYSRHHMHPNNAVSSGLTNIETFPQQMAALMSHVDITDNLSFDSNLYFVDHRPAYLLFGVDVLDDIDDRLRLDVQLQWKPIPELTLAAVGQNLLDDHSDEYRNDLGIAVTQLERAFYAKLKYEFM